VKLDFRDGSEAIAAMEALSARWRYRTRFTVQMTPAGESWNGQMNLASKPRHW